MPAIVPELSAELCFELVDGDGWDVAEEDASDCKDVVRMDVVVDISANVALVSKSLFNDLGTRDWDRRPSWSRQKDAYSLGLGEVSDATEDVELFYVTAMSSSVQAYRADTSHAPDQDK